MHSVCCLLPTAYFPLDVAYCLLYVDVVFVCVLQTQVVGYLQVLLIQNTSNCGHNVHIVYLCIVDTEYIMYLDIRHTVHNVHIVHTGMYVHIYIYTFIYSCILPTVYSLLHAAYCMLYDNRCTKRPK